jgi:quinol monooxygenase YgiN
MLELLQSIDGPTRAQQGCLGFEIWVGGEDPERVLLIERWKGREELERHLKSELYRRVLVAIELSSTDPEVRFLEVGAEHGMEWIEQARGESEAPRSPRGSAAS